MSLETTEILRRFKDINDYVRTLEMKIRALEEGMVDGRLSTLEQRLKMVRAQIYDHAETIDEQTRRFDALEQRITDIDVVEDVAAHSERLDAMEEQLERFARFAAHHDDSMADRLTANAKVVKAELEKKCAALEKELDFAEKLNEQLQPDGD